MAKNLDIVAKHIATIIHTNGGKRITSEQANLGARAAALESSADDLIDNVQALTGNLSALNQELERFGLVQTERSKPALIVAIEKALETLRTAPTPKPGPAPTPKKG